MSGHASVAALHRYPVKSMMGEALPAAELGAQGVRGDRAFALLDEATGKVASAKDPRLWAGLFAFTASYTAPVGAGTLPPVRITRPGHEDVLSSDPDASQRLSRALGRAVRLSAAPPEQPVLVEYWPDIEGLEHREARTEETMRPGSFFDGAAVHLVTTATLDSLARLQPGSRFEPRRFRPNVLVAASEGGFPEAAWIGRRVRLGRDVVLRVPRACGRCVMITLPQESLPQDHGILRAAARHRGAKVGVYAEVEAGGLVKLGDSVRVE